VALGASLTTPFVYIDFANAGPVPDSSLCSNSINFLECRVYAGITTVLVAKLQGTTSSVPLASSLTTLTYPTAYSSDSTNYTVTVLAGTGSTYSRTASIARTQANLKPIANTLSFQRDFYASGKSGYTTVLAVSLQLPRAFSSSDLLQVVFSGVTINAACWVTVASNPSAQFLCLVSGSTISIYTNTSFTQTSPLFSIVVGATNPNTDPTVTARLYQSYTSSSVYVAYSESTATLTLDRADTSNSRLEKSQLLKYPFFAKIYTTSNAPIRIRFRLNSAISAGALKVLTLDHPRLSQVTSTTNVYCILREFTTLNFREVETFLNVFCQKTTAGGTILYVDAPKTTGLTNTAYYELAVLPLLNNNALGTSVIDSGFEPISNFAQVEFRAGPGNYATLQAADVRKWFVYEGLSKISLDSVMTLTTYSNTATSLLINFQLNFASSSQFPGEYIQIILPDIPIASISPGTKGSSPSCYLGSSFTTKTNRQPVKCVLSDRDDYQNMAVLTIYNLGSFSSPTSFSLAVDQVTLPNLASMSLLENTYKMDVRIDYGKMTDNSRFSAYFREILVVEGLTSTPTSQAVTYNQGSSTIRGDPVSNSISGVTWPSTASANISSKLVFQFTGGQVALLSDPSSLSITGLTLLYYFKDTLKYIYQAPA
jgi:hypothetical protein